VAKDYVPLLESRARQLIERLHGIIRDGGEKSSRVDISAWFSYFA
jgi:hypothetical protein